MRERSKLILLIILVLVFVFEVGFVIVDLLGRMKNPRWSFLSHDFFLRAARTSDFYSGVNIFLMISFGIVAVLIITVLVLEKRRSAGQVAEQIKGEEDLGLALGKLDPLSLIFHRFMNLISGVKMPLEMIVDGDFGPVNAVQRRHLVEMQGGLYQLVQAATSILYFVKIESRSLVLAGEPVNPVQVMESVLRRYSDGIAEKKIKIKTRFPSAVPWIHADERSLFVVFQHVFANAVQYVSSGGNIMITFKKDGRYLIVEVSDDGCGVPVDDQKKIGQKFFRAANVREQSFSKFGLGLGLGLYIVRNIVDQFHGHMSFTTGLKQGSLFRLSFPLITPSKKSITL